jgi:hypothetical protein
MDDHTLLNQLEELAQRLTIEIRYVTIRHGDFLATGGFCRIKDKHIIVVNKKSTIQDKIQTLARAIKRFDLSKVYLRPALREFLEMLPE